MTVNEHIGEAIAALTQYLGSRGTGWEVETLGDLQDQTRKAMIAATPCPVCESLGCQTQHGRTPAQEAADLQRFAAAMNARHGEDPDQFLERKLRESRL